MLTKNQIKFISQLHQKKHRESTQLFFVEGVKGVTELLQSSLVLHHLYTTVPLKLKVQPDKVTQVTPAELHKISALTTPNTCLAIFEIPQVYSVSSDGLQVVLDKISDPGNLGTIIRLCDWFGVQEIICSLDTVDAYNPKVVQATMGSITRVRVFYTDLEEFLSKSRKPVIGTFMTGDSVYHTEWPTNALLVMGNEANGISEKIQKFISVRTTIPQFGTHQKTESLNVATATAILLSEFRRGGK